MLIYIDINNNNLMQMVRNYVLIAKTLYRKEEYSIAPINAASYSIENM